MAKLSGHKNKLVGFHPPEELMVLVREKAKAEGQTITQFVIDALWFYLLNKRDG